MGSARHSVSRYLTPFGKTRKTMMMNTDKCSMNLDPLPSDAVWCQHCVTVDKPRRLAPADMYGRDD